MLESELRVIKGCLFDIVFGLTLILITIPIWNTFDINNQQVIHSYEEFLEMENITE